MPKKVKGPALEHGAIIVHGGAGSLPPDEVDGARAGCEHAARLGFEVLRAGGSVLDAVETAVRILEDDPQFNAGRGACLTRAGTVELDAALMRGADLAVGGVGAVTGVKNPVLLARKLLEAGEHGLLVGEGARRFAETCGLDLTAPDHHITPKAQAKYERLMADQRALGSGSAASDGGQPLPGEGGTVGAVAVDGRGRLAAATSTGGRWLKRPGRVGDTPLAGCGTYADDLAGAVSATGHGERIIQVALAKGIIDRLLRGESAPEAAAWGIAELGHRVRGEGGVIVIDAQGRVGFARNTRSMAFAYVVDGADAVSGC